jgi:hypothetical protein
VSLNLYIANAVAERVGASTALQAFDGVVSQLNKLAPRGAENARRASAAPSPHSGRHRSERTASV